MQRAPGECRVIGAAATTIACLLCSSGAPAAEVNPRPPNILLIVADDLGWADLDGWSDIAAHASHAGGFWLDDQRAADPRVDSSASGAESLTRHIDSLAAEGVRFTSFYANAPSCSATRASILTGLYPHRFGITQAILPDEAPNHTLADAGIPGTPLETPTLASRLHDVGYRTAHLGKWHVGRSLPEHMPAAKGFDEFLGYLGAGTNRGRSETEKLCLTKQIRLAPGAGQRDDKQRDDEPCEPPEPCPDGVFCSSERIPGFQTETLTNRAIEFVGRHAAGSGAPPFFLSLAYALPHPAGDLVNPTGVPQRVRRRFANTSLGGYAAMVASLDENVGRLLEAVRVAGLYDDTLVIFTSDNGGVGWQSVDGQRGTHHECIGAGNPETGVGSAIYDACNGRLRGGKHFLFEGGVRVPLLLRWPARFDPNAPFDNGTVMATMDLFPTLVSLAGGAVPTGLDGEVIDLSVRGWQRAAPLFWFEPGPLIEGKLNPHPQFAVRYRDWKLLRLPATGNYDPQLFRISREVSSVTQIVEEDPDRSVGIRPEEDQNHFPSGEHRALSHWMLRAYADWLEQFDRAAVRDLWLEQQPRAPGVPYDFNGDGQADLLTENVTGPRPGLLGVVLLAGTSQTALGSPAKLGGDWSVVGAGQFGAGGRATVVARKNAGDDVGLFRFVSLGQSGLEEARTFYRNGLPRAQELVGLADLNGDYVDDFVFFESAFLESGSAGGRVNVYLVDPDVRRRHFGSIAILAPGERIVALGDLDGDGRADLVLAGRVRGAGAVLHGLITDPTGTGIERRTTLGSVPEGERLAGVGRFDGDDRVDLLFERSRGSGVALRVEAVLPGGEGTRAQREEIERPGGEVLVAIRNFDGLYGDDLAFVRTQDPRRGDVEILLLEPPRAKAIGSGAVLSLPPNARVVRDGSLVEAPSRP